MKRRTFIGASGGALAGAVTGTAGATTDDSLEGIEIRTDEYGVSHVHADSLYRLGYANGYVQARDRLFQMDALRLVGRGESAEWLGPAQLASDIEVRRDLYNREEINRQWDDAPETAREMIRGFCDGVNHQLTKRASTGQLPAEFVALGRVPEPWKPEDTIAIINYAIGFFGVGGGAELSNARTLGTMFRNLGDEAEAWEAYGDLNRVVVPDDHYGSVGDDEIEATDERALEYDEVSEAQLEAIRAAPDAEPWGITELGLPDAVTDGLREATGMMEGFGFGSNAIIVDGEHTETGKPMLGGGPQMGLFKPPVVYEIGLHGADFDATGVGVVGTPAIVVGRTPDLAWTVTTSGDDMVDTVAVELDPDDRHRYRWNGEWHTMATESVTHYTNAWAGTVQGDTDFEVVHQEIARVEQEGTSMPVIAWNPEENVAYCQRVTTRMEELDGAFRWVEIGRSDSLDDFEHRLSEFPFGFNFHVVDDEEIRFVRTGKLPERRGGADPRLPVPPSEHDWGGFDVGTNIGSTVRDPDRGYVVNWNNAPAPGWRAGDSEQQWGSTHRVDVMERLIREALERTNGSLALEDVEGIIEDCSVEHPFAPGSVPAMIDAVRKGETPSLQLATMAAELEAWAETDYSFRPGPDGRYENAGMAIWEEVRHELQELVYRGKLGDETPELDFDPAASDGMGGGDPHAADHGETVNEDVTLVDAIEGETAFRWFDWLDAENHDSWNRQRDEILVMAMERAAETLEERFDDPNPTEWRLEARQSQFSPLGAANPNSVPMTNRATYQQSIAMGEGLAGSKSVLPPANSGHQSLLELPGTLAGEEPDRLTDQLELYADYAYKPHPYSWDQIREVATEERSLETTTYEFAELGRPVADPVVSLLSVPGGGLRAVQDLPRAIDGSVDDLFAVVDDAVSDALNASPDDERSIDDVLADLEAIEAAIERALEPIGGLVGALLDILGVSDLLRMLS